MTDEGDLQSMTSNEKGSKETELDVLREILRWVKFSGMKEVRNILTSVLDNEQKRVVYQMSDGSKGIVEIGKAVGIKSTATIFKLWKQWTKLGLGEPIPVPGGQRFKRSFDLEDFGIEFEAPTSNEPVTNTTVQENQVELTGPKLEECQQPAKDEQRQSTPINIKQDSNV